MLQFGGKDSKRHFTVVMEGKEHGLYVSSTPSYAAKKVVTKLCDSNKGKEVEFYIREITQGSKKKTYGPYIGHIEKLKEPIKLKGRIIKYKPVAKLSRKDSKMRGGQPYVPKIMICIHHRKDTTVLRSEASEEERCVKNINGKEVFLIEGEEVHKIDEKFDKKGGERYFLVEKKNGNVGWVKSEYMGACKTVGIDYWSMRKFDFQMPLRKLGSQMEQRKSGSQMEKISFKQLLASISKKVDSRNAQGTHLEGAHLEGEHLEGAHLEGEHLEGAHLQGAHLEGVDLRGVNL
jgi:hypothetical protein